MPESALLVPVPAAEAAVERLRLQHDPTGRAGVPAHVTVLYPFVPPHQIDDSLVERLQTLFGNVDAFDFELAQTQRFPGILYLEPDPDVPFLYLTKLVYEEWPQHPPYEGNIAIDQLTPHLTVTDGASFEEMEAASEEIARELPIKTRASEVWLMTRFATQWNVKSRFALS